MKDFVILRTNQGQRAINKSRFEDSFLNALQNAYTWLDNFDFQSELSEEDIDIHHHVGKVIEHNEQAILKYLLRLSKKQQL